MKRNIKQFGPDIYKDPLALLCLGGGGGGGDQTAGDSIMEDLRIYGVKDATLPPHGNGQYVIGLWKPMSSPMDPPNIDDVYNVTRIPCGHILFMRKSTTAAFSITIRCYYYETYNVAAKRWVLCNSVTTDLDEYDIIIDGKQYVISEKSVKPTTGGVSLYGRVFAVVVQCSPGVSVSFFDAEHVTGEGAVKIQDALSPDFVFFSCGNDSTISVDPYVDNALFGPGTLPDRGYTCTACVDILADKVTPVLTNLFCGFSGVKNIAINKINGKVGTSSQSIRLTNTFKQCYNLRLVHWPVGINIAYVSDMAGAFFGCHNLEALDASLHLIGLDSSIGSVESSDAFYGCQNLPYFVWDGKPMNNSRPSSFSVKNGARMFANCLSMKTALVDIYLRQTGDAKFCTGSMEKMFEGCTNLVSLMLHFNTQYMDSNKEVDIDLSLLGLNGSPDNIKSLRLLDLSFYYLKPENWNGSDIDISYCSFTSSDLARLFIGLPTVTGAPSYSGPYMLDITGNPGADALPMSEIDAVEAKGWTIIGATNIVDDVAPFRIKFQSLHVNKTYPNGVSISGYAGAAYDELVMETDEKGTISKLPEVAFFYDNDPENPVQFEEPYGWTTLPPSEWAENMADGAPPGDYEIKNGHVFTKDTTVYPYEIAEA